MKETKKERKKLTTTTTTLMNFEAKREENEITVSKRSSFMMCTLFKTVRL